jgi:hypothetical protein
MRLKYKGVTMKTLYAHFSLILITLLLSVSPALAAPKLQDVSGTIMAAETNKAVTGAEISFFSRRDNIGSRKPPEQPRTATEFQASLRPVHIPGSPGPRTGNMQRHNGGDQTGRAQASTCQTGRTVRRLVGNSGIRLPGHIHLDSFNSSASAANGRAASAVWTRAATTGTAQTGLGAGKSAYYYLTRAKKDAGDLIIRRAATVKVRIAAREQGQLRQTDKIMVNLSGNTIYRSIRTDNNSLATMTDLPPGRYSLSVSDERLQETRQELEIIEGQSSAITLAAELKPPIVSIEEYSEVFLPDKPARLRVNGLRVEKGEALLSRVSEAALLDGSVDLRKPDAIPGGALKKLTTLPVAFKARRDSHSRFGRIPLPALQPGAYLLELRGSGAASRFAFW